MRTVKASEVAPMSLTVRILPTDEPTIEVRITDEPHGFIDVQLTPAEAIEHLEEVHRAVYLTTINCAHPSCRNHATREDGYCGRCGA